jgi:chitodextrinase
MTAKMTLGKPARLHGRVPFMAHLAELIVAIAIFSAGQNVWAVLVKAAPDITPPSVPTGLTMTGRSATSIDLSWTASTDDTGVTGYHVFRDGSVVSTVTSTSYSDPNLAPNTGYTYTVSAFDAAANESAQSASLSVTTLADTSPPSVPTNLHQTGQSTSTISIAWNASSDNVGVTAYNIYRNGSLVKSQSGTTYTDTGLAVYTGYIYTITARDAANNGSNISSQLVASTAQDVTPPSVPDNISEPSNTITSVSLSWVASTDDVGVAGYHVYRNGSLVGSPGGTTYTDTGLSVGSNYTYTISAYDAAGNTSAQSAAFSASSSTDTTPPTIPANVHTTSVLDTSMTLGWDASTDDVGVVGYKIYRDGTLVGTATTPSFTDTGLTPVTNYAYTVKAYDAANNNSAASATLNTTTAYDTTAPSVPANLHSTTQTDSTISLTWDAATDNVAVSGYNIYRGGTLITTTSGTTFTDSGLSVNTLYTYRISAVDTSSNTSSQTAPSNFSTLPDTTLPTAPNTVTTSNATTTTVDITWSSGTDDVAVASYKLYRNGALVGTFTGLTHTDSGLHYNTAYSYTVSTVDASGNESIQSSAAIGQTLPDTTAPIVSLTAPTDGSAPTLTFPISATASDDLDLNRVEFYADSLLINTIYTAPFTFNWNSYAVHNGTHVITAKAIDGSGNVATQAVTISLNNPPPAIIGDLNNDHKVNLYDLSIFLSHWGKSGAGDFNNNGRVDIFDLSVLLSHYGQDTSGYH